LVGNARADAPGALLGNAALALLPATAAVAGRFCGEAAFAAALLGNTVLVDAVSAAAAVSGSTPLADPGTFAALLLGAAAAPPRNAVLSLGSTAEPDFPVGAALLSIASAGFAAAFAVGGRTPAGGSAPGVCAPAIWIPRQPNRTMRAI
jgi:hypothetical protein